MTTKKALGYRIAQMRGFNRLNQEELGEMCGVRKQTISGWENGRNAPDAERLALLSKALDCSVDYLLGLVDNPHEYYRGGRNA